MPTVNGTTYHKDTPAEVIRILEAYRGDRTKRLRLAYGDTETGRDWGETNDVEGYIGRSTGTQKIPLLIHSLRSTGGPAILGHCIVRIQLAKGKRELYRHPKYHVEEATV